MSAQTLKKLIVNQQILIILIVLFGAAVRIIGLPSVGNLSFDEAWSVWIAQKDITSAFEIVAQDKHPPLFYGLLYVWVRLVGASEFGLRMMSVVAGVVGVATLYRVGREMFDRTTGVVAALLIAVSPFQIWYSQEARMYPLVLAFSLLSVFFLWKARDRNASKYWVGYIVSTLLLGFTHYIAGLLVFGQGVFLLLDAFLNRERLPVLQRWLLFLFAMFLVSLPWLPRLVSQTQIDSGPPPWIAQVYGSPSLKDLYNTFFRDFLLAVPEFYPRWLRLATYFAGTGLITLAVFKIRPCFPFLKVTSQEAVVLCLLCLVLPIGILWLLSQVWPTYVPRYLLAFSGYLYLLLAWGIRRVPTRWGNILAALLLVVTMTRGSVQLYGWQRERDWNTIVDYVLAQWQEGDVVVIMPPANWIVFDYYAQGRIPHDLEFYRRLYPSYPDPSIEEELSSALLNQPLPYQRLWWIDEQGTGLAAEWEADPDQVVPRFLDQYFSQVETPCELSSRWGNVLLYRLNTPDELEQQ